MTVLSIVRNFLITLLMLGFCVGQAFALSGNPQAGWWDDTPWKDPDRGFNWYPPDKPKQGKETTPKQKSIKEMTSMEEIQKELKRLQDLAILTPTQSNVLAFLEAQQWLMEKSSVFADTTRRVVWQNPQVDYNNRSPVANFALTAKRDMRRQEQQVTLAELSRDYGLMFFFRSDCNFCHQQAPVLKMLEARYGLPVMAVSLDGGGIQQFPDAKRDNGVSMMISGGQGIQHVPALYLVQRESKAAILIGTGVLAQDEIVERIRVLTRTTPGQEF